MSDAQFVWVMTLGHQTPPSIRKYPLVKATAATLRCREQGRVITIHQRENQSWYFSDVEALAALRTYCMQQITAMKTRLARFEEAVISPLVIDVDQNPLPKSGELNL